MSNHTQLLMQRPRKIIHLDMDCFYAAIEIRDNPLLHNKPVAVGGSAKQRGVLCTCNYIARQYGVHSAMPTAIAYRKCPDLIVLPVDMNKYREVSREINTIFHQYTDLVEPLSLDEAFLDVTDAVHCQGSATRIAQAIQNSIFTTQHITASAGVAPNKFLAKIASAWQKPNGLFVIKPDQVTDFVKELPINKLFGVGKVTALKLNELGIFTCSDLQGCSLNYLIHHFGKLGQQLYYQSRGIDNRAVQPNRLRKSLSVERTFAHDLIDFNQALDIIKKLSDLLMLRISEHAANLQIKNQFIKMKSSDFKLISAEAKSNQLNPDLYAALFQKSFNYQSIRLLGVGVHFQYGSTDTNRQLSLFDTDIL